MMLMISSKPRQVWNQPDVLRTESQRWELRPGHLPHSVHLRHGRAPCAVGEFAPPAAPGQENSTSDCADIWRLRLSCVDRNSGRYFDEMSNGKYFMLLFDFYFPLHAHESKGFPNRDIPTKCNLCNCAIKMLILQTTMAQNKNRTIKLGLFAHCQIFPSWSRSSP